MTQGLAHLHPRPRNGVGKRLGSASFPASADGLLGGLATGGSFRPLSRLLPSCGIMRAEEGMPAGTTVRDFNVIVFRSLLLLSLHVSDRKSVV